MRNSCTDLVVETNQCFHSKFKITDELWYSTLFLAQKSATNHGHGKALLAFWKNSSSDYQLNHNVGRKQNHIITHKDLWCICHRPTTVDKQQLERWQVLVSMVKKYRRTRFTTAWSTTKVSARGRVPKKNPEKLCPFDKPPSPPRFAFFSGKKMTSNFDWKMNNWCVKRILHLVTLKNLYICFCYISIISGLPHTNVEMDLVVEHWNAILKQRLAALGGRYTEEAIERIGSSLNLSSLLEEKLYPTYIDRLKKLPIWVDSVVINHNFTKW